MRAWLLSIDRGNGDWGMGTRVRVLKFDGAIAPRVLKFDAPLALRVVVGAYEFIEGALL